MNEFNKNDIWSMHRDVFMIRLADNWKEQILPHTWPDLVSQSFWWRSVSSPKKQGVRCSSAGLRKDSKNIFEVGF